MTFGTAFDLIVIAIVLVSAGVAFFRGFIRELLTILGVVGGVLAAFFVGPLFFPVTREWFGVKEGVEPEQLFGIVPYSIIADAAAYGGVFLVVVVVLHLLSMFIAGVVRSAGLGPVDRTLGVVFGVVRGILLVGLIYLPFSVVLTDKNKEDFFSTSKFYVYVKPITDWMSTFLPDSKTDDDAQAQGDNKGMRDILKSIDVLSDEQKKKALSAVVPSAAAPLLKEGYNDGQRDKLNGLIQTEEMKNRDLNE